LGIELIIAKIENNKAPGDDQAINVTKQDEWECSIIVRMT
jgi:hypothetical protein